MRDAITETRRDRSEIVEGRSRHIILSIVCFILPLTPSPALVPPAGVVIVGSAVVLLVLGLQIGTSVGQMRELARPFQILFVVGGALFIGMALADPSGGGLLRLVARSMYVLTILAFGTNIVKLNAEGVGRICRAFVYGAAAVSLLAIATSITGVAIAGELRPSRGIGLLPGGAKSAGVIRSYGEAAIIYSGALALLHYQRTHFSRIVRWGLFVSIVFGASVSHSRNVYATMLFTTGLLALHSLRLLPGRNAWRFTLRAAMLTAFLTPLFVGILIGSAPNNPAAEYFIGEGTQERAVESRVNHVTTAFDLILNDPQILLRGSSVETWREALGADGAPHNQFISLLLFTSPALGIFVISTLYLRPVWHGAGLYSFDDLPVAIWGAGSIYALSSYEGLFSGSLALCVALQMAMVYRYRHHLTGTSESTR